MQKTSHLIYKTLIWLSFSSESIFEHHLDKIRNTWPQGRPSCESTEDSLSDPSSAEHSEGRVNIIVYYASWGSDVP